MHKGIKSHTPQHVFLVKFRYNNRGVAIKTILVMILDGVWVITGSQGMLLWFQGCDLALNPPPPPLLGHIINMSSSWSSHCDTVGLHSNFFYLIFTFWAVASLVFDSPKMKGDYFHCTDTTSCFSYCWHLKVERNGGTNLWCWRL